MIFDFLNIVCSRHFRLTRAFHVSVWWKWFLTGNFRSYVFLNLLRFSNEWWFLSTSKFLKFVFSLFRTFNFIVVASGCKTGYYNLPIFISFVKLIVVMNINVQSNVRSQNGSCDWTAPVVDSCNFLRFYFPPRSLESLSVFFPSTFKFGVIWGIWGNSHCNRPFSKIL